MKTKLLLSILLSFVFCLLSSQIPQGFTYQAIVRNTSGLVIQNQPVKILVSIQTAGSTVFWNEEHSLTTTQFGLANFIIGDGPNVSGTITNFSKIDWNAQTLFLRTQVQYPVGSPYTDLGTTQIWSVPYSLMAKDVEGPISKLGIRSFETNNDSALFKVINRNGDIVFAVYNEGVRVHVADATKGKKGGFAVGSFGSDKSESQPYMLVTADSIRMYLDSNPLTKKPKGGFAVGGYDMSKDIVFQNYLDVSEDSVRIYIDTNPLTKGKKGGFGVGGYDMAKNLDINFLNVTPDSTRVYVNEPGSVMNKSGFSVRGRNPVSYKEGDYMNLASYNSKIFSRSTFSKTQEYTSWNLLVDSEGHIDTVKLMRAGYGNLSMTIPYSMPVKGEDAKFEVKTMMVAKGLPEKVISIGKENIAVGTGSSIELSGLYNNIIGNFHGSHDPMDPVSGNFNVMVGTGNYNNPANDNVLIGSGMVASGDKNVCIGPYAGSARTPLESNKLYIANTGADKTGALIYGEFDNSILRLNARVTIRDALKLEPRLTPPSSPTEGEIYYNSELHKLFVFDGTTWQACW